MANILVVDDVEGMREALCDLLNKHGYKVTKAANGRMACEILGQSKFDLVISDIQMPFLSGIELLKWIKKNKPIPVILMTGFSQILETSEAFALGADDFLAKPFKYSEVLDRVEKLIKRPRKSADKNMDGEYCRVPIEDFVSNNHLNASIHVRLSNSKYIRVSHKGDVIPKDRVDIYKQRGVHFLYILKEEFANVVGFNLYLSKSLLSSNIVSPEKKAGFLRYTTETVLEQIGVNGIDQQSFGYAKECATNNLRLIADSASLFQLLDVLNEHANWLYAHSMGVSVYGAMIAKKLGWSSAINLFKITMAGLFHDIGIKEIDREIVEKQRPLLSQKERAIYETHPSRGRDILGSLKEVPEDVIQVAYEHHEDCLGGGFPRRVPKNRVHPLAKVIAVADVFCYRALKSPHSEGCEAKEAMAHLESFGQELDKNALAALKQLCQ